MIRTASMSQNDIPCTPPTPRPIDQDSGVVDRARALLAGGKVGTVAARQLLEEQIRRDPDLYPPLDLECELLVDAGEADLARRLLEEYIRYHPSKGDPVARLAWVMWHLGRRDEAVAEIRALLARQPDHVAARAWNAEWALESGDTLRALTEAETALEMEPDHPSLLLTLARAAARNRDEGRARRAFGRLLELNPAAEETARLYARFLLDQNHLAEAARTLGPFLALPTVQHRTLLLQVDALGRLEQFPLALQWFRRLATDPAIDDDTFVQEAISLLHKTLGLKGGDDFLFDLLGQQALSDAFALEFLERCGQRGNRGHLIRLYQVIGHAPLRFPRTMTRFLSTYHSAPLMPGAVARWVAAHRAEIEQEALLWGGVGAWHIARGAWREAATHLSRHEGRPGVRPWMLLLLGRALEELGERGEANRHYRNALLMPPDHAEAAIRSRLAFNMALEGMPGVGQILLLDCSETGKKNTTTEDLVRILAVESLGAAVDMHLADERRELFEATLNRMKEVVQGERLAEANRVIKLFRQHTNEILQRMNT